MPGKQQVLSQPAAPKVELAISLREFIALAVILLVALLVRIPGLTDSLWFDEIWYTQTTFSQPDQLGFLLWEDVHPPAYPLLLVAWTDLFGDSELAVRLPSFLCGMASLGLMWFVARRWTGPVQALLVTALLALSPPHIWYSYENKVNMMLLLFTLWSAWLYWRASETNLKRDWFVASVVQIMALYTHAYAVPVAVAVFLWLGWRALGNRSLLKPILISGCVVAIVFAPMALLKFSQRSDLGRGYLRQLTPGEIYKLLLIWLPSGNTLRTIGPYKPFANLFAQPWPYFLIEAFFAFVLGRGLWVVGRRARGDGWLAPVTNPAMTQPARLMLLWILVPLLFTVAGSLATRDFYIERNLLVILPPFLMVLAIGADMGSPRWAKMALIGGLLALAVAATVNLLFFKTEVWTVYKYKPDWRSAANYFREESRLINPLRVLVTIPSVEFDYYKRHVILAGTAAGTKQEPVLADVCNANLDEILPQIAQARWEMLYLVKNKTWARCWDRAWESFSNAPQLQLVEQREFSGLIIAKFRVVDHDQP